MSKISQKVSMTDIARHLSLSQATVSYVLSGRTGGSISESTRERVLEAAQQMGYRRNRAAQALAGHRSNLVELCVWGLHPAFYAQALDAFDQQLRPTPYESLIVNLSSSKDEDWTASTGIWPVDGIIVHRHLPENALSSLISRDTPIVSTGTEPNTEVDHVFVDLTPAVLGAMRHLSERCDRIMYISPENTKKWVPNIDPRYAAYQQVMQENESAGEVILTPQTEGVTSRVLVRETVCNAIIEKGCPEGIFCFNDEIAIATLAALRDLGLRVPQDVLLIGCDGIEETNYHSPTLSTIQYPFATVAQTAWKFLQARIENPNLPQQKATLTAELVLRESSAR